MRLILKIEPIPKGRPRVGKFGVYTPKKTRAYTEHIKKLCAHLEPLEGALAIHITYYVKRPKTVKRKHPCVKPDIDNFDKALLDALNGLAFKDDAQIIRKFSEKVYANEGKITVELWKIE